MCYGDIDHGNDGYYRQYMEDWEQAEAQRQHEQEQQRPEDQGPPE